MKRKPIFLRASAVFLTFVLSAPNPAFALRAPEKAEAKGGLEELHLALLDSNDPLRATANLLARQVSTAISIAPAAPLPVTPTAGLEELGMDRNLAAEWIHTAIPSVTNTENVMWMVDMQGELVSGGSSDTLEIDQTYKVKAIRGIIDRMGGNPDRVQVSIDPTNKIITLKSVQKSVAPPPSGFIPVYNTPFPRAIAIQKLVKAFEEERIDAVRVGSSIVVTRRNMEHMERDLNRNLPRSENLRLVRSGKQVIVSAGLEEPEDRFIRGEDVPAVLEKLDGDLRSWLLPGIFSGLFGIEIAPSERAQTEQRFIEELQGYARASPDPSLATSFDQLSLVLPGIDPKERRAHLVRWIQIYILAPHGVILGINQNEQMVDVLHLIPITRYELFQNSRRPELSPIAIFYTQSVLRPMAIGFYAAFLGSVFVQLPMLPGAGDSRERFLVTLIREELTHAVDQFVFEGHYRIALGKESELGNVLSDWEEDFAFAIFTEIRAALRAYADPNDENLMGKIETFSRFSEDILDRMLSSAKGRSDIFSSNEIAVLWTAKHILKARSLGEEKPAETVWEKEFIDSYGFNPEKIFEKSFAAGLEEMQVVLGRVREQADGFQSVSAADSRAVVVIGKELAQKFIGLQVYAAIWDRRIVIDRGDLFETLTQAAQRGDVVHFYGDTERGRLMESLAGRAGLPLSFVLRNPGEYSEDSLLLAQILRDLGIPSKAISAGLEEFTRDLQQLGQAA